MADLDSFFNCFDEAQNDQTVQIPVAKPKPEDP